MSWIHIDDLLRMYIMALDSSYAHGIYNAVAPQPVTNQEFTQTLAKCFDRKTFLPVPTPALKLALGEMSTLLLDSARVLPQSLQQEDFSFKFPELGLALEDVIAKVKSTKG